MSMVTKKLPETSPNGKDPQGVISKKLLGKLEAEVMNCMWECQEGTVQSVVATIGKKRPLAYTTVMTVMGHLVDKGLLSRLSDGKRYLYKVAKTREEFLRSALQNVVRQTLNDFGDLAIAGFLGEISKMKPEKLVEIKGLLREATDEEPSPE